MGDIPTPVGSDRASTRSRRRARVEGKQAARVVALQQGEVDQREVPLAIGEAHLDPLGGAADLRERHAAGRHEPRRRAGRGRLDELGEDVVRARGDRDERHVRPGTRDGAVGAVAAEHDQRAAARVAHGSGRAHGVDRRRLGSPQVEQVDRELREMQRLGGPLGHAEDVRHQQQPGRAGGGRTDGDTLDLTPLRLRGLTRGARRQAPNVAARQGIGDHPHGPGRDRADGRSSGGSPGAIIPEPRCAPGMGARAGVTVYPQGASARPRGPGSPTRQEREEPIPQITGE